MLRVLGVSLGLGLVACGPRLQPAELRVGNVGHGAGVQFCVRAGEGEVFVPIPRPASGAPAYRLGDFSVTLRTEPGRKVLRVTSAGADCGAPSTVAEDLALEVSPAAATTVVLRAGRLVASGRARPGPLPSLDTIPVTALSSEDERR